MTFPWFLSAGHSGSGLNRPELSRTYCLFDLLGVCREIATVHVLLRLCNIEMLGQIFMGNEVYQSWEFFFLQRFFSKRKNIMNALNCVCRLSKLDVNSELITRILPSNF